MLAVDSRNVLLMESESPSPLPGCLGIVLGRGGDRELLVHMRWVYCAGVGVLVHETLPGPLKGE